MSDADFARLLRCLGTTDLYNRGPFVELFANGRTLSVDQVKLILPEIDLYGRLKLLKKVSVDLSTTNLLDCVGQIELYERHRFVTHFFGRRPLRVATIRKVLKKVELYSRFTLLKTLAIDASARDTMGLADVLETYDRERFYKWLLSR